MYSFFPWHCSYSSEATEAAESLIELDAAKREFEADGVPMILSLELTRRVLDVDIAASRELVAPDDGGLDGNDDSL